MQGRDGSELNGQHRDVILLAEILCGRSQRGASHSVMEQLADALEAEEPTLRILGLGHAVGHQD